MWNDEMDEDAIKLLQCSSEGTISRWDLLIVHGTVSDVEETFDCNGETKQL